VFGDARPRDGRDPGGGEQHREPSVADKYIRDGGEITKCSAQKHSSHVMTKAERAKAEREAKKAEAAAKRKYRKKVVMPRSDDDAEAPISLQGDIAVTV
jgi:hypothetical protein